MTSPAFIRPLLEERRDQLAERLARVRQDLVRAEGPLDKDSADAAIQQENDEVLNRLEATTYAELRQTRRALQRLKAGLYGVCQDCGAKIDVRRLRAVLDATTCAACAAAHVQAA